jgi:hypothetical protein
MSDDSEKMGEIGPKFTRRELLEKTALVVGGATASVVTARSALARSSDVSIDSSGKVAIDGSILRGQDIKDRIPGKPASGTEMAMDTMNGRCKIKNKPCPTKPASPTRYQEPPKTQDWYASPNTQYWYAPPKTRQWYDGK